MQGMFKEGQATQEGGCLMTEEQRIKLEEFIFEFEQVVLLTTEHRDKVYTRRERNKAHDRITDHLDTIQGVARGTADRWGHR